MRQKSIRVSVVKYLNSIPFVYGLEKSAEKLKLEIKLDNPSECARKLKAGEVDLGLIPISEFSSIPGGQVVGDYCIGAEGPVHSVCLAAEKPIEELKRIYMDPHSRTSINLAKILSKELWKKEFVWLDAEDGFEKELIRDTDGGVVIGDKVFEISGKYEFQYDLAEAWKELTGLPFVFAVWVATRPLDEDWVDEFNKSLAMGVGSIPEVLSHFPYHEKLSDVDLLDYLTNKISYSLDKQKRAGMALFLQKINNLK